MYEERAHSQLRSTVTIRMALSREHTSAKAADRSILLLLCRRNVNHLSYLACRSTVRRAASI